ncbi:deoxyribose-phosphate aldolase [Lentinula edodes]|uniref:Deoxyribose-phosphate aldolase n=1 Tax=Lentinula edodes TaxID=5353 RepID=A0A1Q3ESK2_LENED|nr:deoxyribose-phosphate aldolase [Lentinula edodes]
MSSPTVSQNKIADQIGFSAYFDVVYILGASLFYGLSLPVFALSINVLRQRAPNSKPVRFLLILTCLTLFSVTGQFITNVGETLTGLSWSQSPSDSISYLDRMASASARAEPYGIASLIFQVLNFFAGDVIVVWRASVLWSHSRAVRYTLCVLLAGSAAASIYDVTNFSIILTSNKGASGNGFLKGDASSMFVSLAVNLAATSCIMSKAWLFRQSIKKTMSRDQVNKNVSFKILLSLVECGLFYCAVQAANGTLTVDDNAPSVLGRAIVAQFTSFFAGTHSALVISIIASQKSILEISSAVVGSHREPLMQDVEKGVGALPKRSTIRFAPGQFVSGESEQSASGDYGNGFFTTINQGASMALTDKEWEIAIEEKISQLKNTDNNGTVAAHTGGTQTKFITITHPLDPLFPLTIDHTLLKPDATSAQIDVLCYEAISYGFKSSHAA